MALNTEDTRFLIVVETQPSIVVEMRPLIAVEMWLLKCGDRVRCFAVRTQAPLRMCVCLGDPKVIENFRA